MPAKPKHETLSRLLELLKALPHHGWATPRELKNHLASLGFEVDLRSIQRDLKELQSSFPVDHNDKGRPHGWRWSPEAARGITGMGAAEALMLVLVQRHLQSALPASMLEGFEPLFTRASQRLDQLGPRAGATRWPQKVAAVSPGLKNIPPVEDLAVRKALSEALLAERQVDAVYAPAGRAASRSYRLHPVGLILRGSVTYLAATTGGDTAPLLYAVHRFKTVDVRADAAHLPAGCDLAAALDAGRDQFGSGGLRAGGFSLELACDTGLAGLLSESPLGRDQRISDLPDGRRRVKVTACDSWELRWWLMGHGAQLEVISPHWLRQDIARSLGRAASQYT